jgi:hypothetical protein
MSIQVQAYIDDMNKTYFEIMKKCIDHYELSEADEIFLKIYERTIKGRIS